MQSKCAVCQSGLMKLYRDIDAVGYYQCGACGSILADEQDLTKNRDQKTQDYSESFWENELKGADYRYRGASLLRVAETFRMARNDIHRFLDISTGNGGLLDSLDELLPERSDMFYGVEPFPPPEPLRTRHKNYRVGYVGDLDGVFEAGTCIEVIEHLFPDTLRLMLADLAKHSVKGSLFYFNSCQPSFVKESYPTYLSPFVSGHIASYSTQGLTPLFAEAGFTLHPLPGRDWGFFAEYGAWPQESLDSFFTRLWHPNEANLATLSACRYGPLFAAMGLESARCYLEAATAQKRTEWAQSLNSRIEALGKDEDQAPTTLWHRVKTRLGY